MGNKSKKDKSKLSSPKTKNLKTIGAKKPLKEKVAINEKVVSAIKEELAEKRKKIREEKNKSSNDLTDKKRNKKKLKTNDAAGEKIDVVSGEQADKKKKKKNKEKKESILRVETAPSQKSIVPKPKKKPLQEEGKLKSYGKQNSVADLVRKSRRRKLRRLKMRENKLKLSDDQETDSVKRILILENLPISMLSNYREEIDERFSKYGNIRNIGPCEFDEMTADEQFKTTVVFRDVSSATKALEENNMQWKENRLVVRRANEAKETTMVLRKVQNFKESLIRSLFSPCGPIRRINPVKKYDLYTVFVEFWRPESLKEALSIAEDIKIGGRKLLIGVYNRTNKPIPQISKSPKSPLAS